MKKIILFIFIFCCNLTMAQKPVYVHDPFTVYYPHLGDSICRIKSFEIDSDTSLNTEKKLKLGNSIKIFVLKMEVISFF